MTSIRIENSLTCFMILNILLKNKIYQLINIFSLATDFPYFKFLLHCATLKNICTSLYFFSYKNIFSVHSIILMEVIQDYLTVLLLILSMR